MQPAWIVFIGLVSVSTIVLPAWFMIGHLKSAYRADQERRSLEIWLAEPPSNYVRNIYLTRLRSAKEGIRTALSRALFHGILVVVGVGVIAVIPRAARAEWLRGQRERCQRCGYLLHGLAARCACPECGALRRDNAQLP